MRKKRKGALSRIKMEEPEEKEAMATGAEQHRTSGVEWVAKKEHANPSGFLYQI
jgi:hypothetical protein